VRRPATVGHFAVVVAATTLLFGCESTVDPEIAARENRTSTPVGTTIPLASDRAGLLGQLHETAAQLSEALVVGHGEADPLIARIDAIWSELEPYLDGAEPVIARELGRAVDLLHLAVDRRRPADADKATINIARLIADLDAAPTSPPLATA